MRTIITKRITFAMVIAFFSFTLIYADGGGNGSVTPIIFEPIDTVKPFSPKAPSYIKLSGYVVEDGVVITSNVDVMAEVKIFDAASSQTYYNSIVTLAPDCRCPLPPVDAELTLQVIIDNKIYQGLFSIQKN